MTGSTIATPPGSKNIFLLSEVDTEGGSRTYNLICLDKAKATVVWKTPNLTAYDSGGTPLYPQFISNLCLANSQIFFQLENKLYGYSEAGTPLWPPLMIGPSSITPAGPSTSTPVYANGQIFVGTYDGRLLAVNSVTGNITWSAQLNQGQFLYITAAPAVGHGNVYIGGSDGYFYAFSAANGSLIWKSQVVNLATYNQSHFISDYFTVMGAPLVAGSAVFLQVGVNNDWSGTLHGLLCALDAGSGKVLWKVDPTKLALPVRVATPTGIPNFGPWYASGNLVYTTLGILSTGATTASSQAELASAEVLLALNQADGSLHSFFAAPVDGEMLQTGFFPSSPVPVPGGLAFMTNEPAIYVLNV